MNLTRIPWLNPDPRRPSRRFARLVALAATVAPGVLAHDVTSGPHFIGPWVGLPGPAAGHAASLVPSTEPTPRGVWPLEPRPVVVRGFEPPSVDWESGHRGVDLAGSVAQTVRTALPGVVSFSGRIGGKPVVVVSHGETRTTYEPVVGVAHVGDQVAAGEAIGRLVVESSHCFPSACLHWGWRRGDVYLNPLDLVGEAPPVRLLPLDGLP